MAQGLVGVRPRRAEEMAALVEMLREVHLKDGYPSRWPEDPEGWLSPPGLTRAWVAEDPETGLLGHVGVVTDGEGPAGVTRLFVSPAARGRGLALGARLLEAVTEWAREQGLGLVLDVVEDGGAAIALYERLGWQLVERGTADWETADGRRLPLRIYRAPGIWEAEDQPGKTP